MGGGELGLALFGALFAIFWQIGPQQIWQIWQICPICRGQISGAQFAAPTFSRGLICRGPICRCPICRKKSEGLRSEVNHSKNIKKGDFVSPQFLGRKSKKKQVKRGRSNK